MTIDNQARSTTPLPWGIRPTECGFIFALTNPANEVIRLETRNEANAALVVRAVNSHDALLAALQRAVAWCSEHGDTRHKWYSDAVRAIASTSKDES